MLIIGLTGGSGSGKGYISRLLENKDTVIIDTDRVYHEMISRGGELVDVLCCEFGNGIIDGDGGIDRRALGRIVFSDKTKLERLNSLTHKAILDKSRQIIASSGKKYAIVDAPLLFESGFDKECDLKVGVTASTQTRIERIMDRDMISRDAALSRIKNQKNNGFFEEMCDIIIVNDQGDITPSIEKLKDEMIRLYGEKEKKEQAQV